MGITNISGCGNQTGMIMEVWYGEHEKYRSVGTPQR